MVLWFWLMINVCFPGIWLTHSPDWLMDWQTDGQTDRWTDWRTDGLTNWSTICFNDSCLICRCLTLCMCLCVCVCCVPYDLCPLSQTVNNWQTAWAVCENDEAAFTSCQLPVTSYQLLDYQADIIGNWLLGLLTACHGSKQIETDKNGKTAGRICYTEQKCV